MAAKERYKSKLLVEGNDDKHVIWALCEKFGVPETFDVVDCEGIDNLLLEIPLRLKQPGIKAIGIIIDADADVKRRYESLSALLAPHGFNFPQELSVNGLIVEANDIKIGIWIMPNNSLNGMLEDFVSFLVPKEDQLMSVVTDTLEHIEKNELNQYSTIHRSKAMIHSWLSWQSDPGTPMGLAITKKYLTTDENTCQKLISWILNTFN